MKVYNLTDRPTPALQRAGLVRTPLKVGGIVVLPGQSAKLKGTAKERVDANAHRRKGALSIDGVPEGYTPVAAAEAKVEAVVGTMPSPPPTLSAPPLTVETPSPVSVTGPTMLPEVPEAPGAPLVKDIAPEEEQVVNDVEAEEATKTSVSKKTRRGGRRRK